jgi:hypothetical protein
MAVFVLGAPSAQAALLDANCPGPPNGFEASGSQAQTFTAQRTGGIVRAELSIGKSAGADFQMQILNANAFGPIDGAIGSATIPDSSLPNRPNPGDEPTAIQGTFNPQVSVTAGHQYAIVLTRPGGPSWLTRDRNGNPCPGNEFTKPSPSTWAVKNPDFDYPFQTFVEPSNQVSVKSQIGRTLTVTVPNDGTVSVTGVPVKIGGKGVAASAKKKALIAGSQIAVSAAGDVAVPLSLTKPGKGRLRLKGKLSSNVTVTFLPTGGQAGSIEAPVKLKRKKGKR